MGEGILLLLLLNFFLLQWKLLINEKDEKGKETEKNGKIKGKLCWRIGRKCLEEQKQSLFKVIVGVNLVVLAVTDEKVSN